MGRDFDPRVEWLHLPPEGGQPTHYELLGLSPFEDRLDHIRDGYWKRFEWVRKYEVGPYGEHALSLLDQLSRAFQCLSNEESKQHYDDELRRIAGETQPKLEVATLPKTASETPTTEQPASVETSGAAVAFTRRKPAMIAAAVVVALLAAIAVAGLRKGKAPAVGNPPLARQSAPVLPRRQAPSPSIANAERPTERTKTPAATALASSSAAIPAREQPSPATGETPPHDALMANGSQLVADSSAAPAAHEIENPLADALPAPSTEMPLEAGSTEASAGITTNETEADRELAASDPRGEARQGTPAIPTSYELPSGKTWNLQAMLVDPNELLEQMKERVEDRFHPMQFVTLAFDGNESALRAAAGYDQQNRLHGPCVEFFENQNVRRAATFKNGACHGRMWIWDVAGEPTLIAEYQNGRLSNLSCLFQNGQPRLILQYDKGQAVGIYPLDGPKVNKSYANLTAVPVTDSTTREFVEIWKATQTEIEDDFNALKRQIRDESRSLTAGQRQTLAAQRSVAVRSLISQRENARRAASQQGINALRLQSGLP